jgi:hypothetical protein
MHAENPTITIHVPRLLLCSINIVFEYNYWIVCRMHRRSRPGGRHAPLPACDAYVLVLLLARAMERLRQLHHHIHGAHAHHHSWSERHWSAAALQPEARAEECMGGMAAASVITNNMTPTLYLPCVNIINISSSADHTNGYPRKKSHPPHHSTAVV